MPDKKHNHRWPAYDPQAIEPKWQQAWEEGGLYLALEAGNKPKFYCLDYFPYPSGEGLHVGHCRNYIPTDVISRYKRMKGYNVLHPMGWDAFGEPSEQFAVAHGVHPRQVTDRNTANFRRQVTILGNGYDWTREIDSSDPRYYRWTQWFFLMLYRRGLAYRDLNWQWWCPTCQTTLSSHEVVGGVCWRGHPGVTRREIPAWYFKITAYADELLSGLDEIDWPESVRAMQRNWIGRSEGCELVFHSQAGEAFPVFTTRPDTIYGVTFFALAPEHPLINAITSPAQRAEIDAYVQEAVRRSEVERMADTSHKTGVFTGGYVTNPLSGESIPVWVADYVLPSYGSGAVMGVPAHDGRDFDFARQFGLPVREVIVPQPGTAQEAVIEQAYTGEGFVINSGPYTGLPSGEAARRIVTEVESRGLGQRAVKYRMRDWLISRQRYWGAPIPIVHCQDCGEVPVPADQLPVLLPEMDDFKPDGSGRSPLARLPGFVNTTCPACGGPARRETDTMGGFACSSWYFLRFTSPNYDQGPFEPQAMAYWMPVDLYVGGAEHAVLHLLYARFWTKVMADAGLVPFREPFPRLLNQGQLMGPDGQRMSKSRGNVITPDSIVATHGADALRIYEMFMAPFEQDVDWSDEGITGARRFIKRVWALYRDLYHASGSASDRDPALERLLHKTIRRVSERIEGFRFNTMVSGLMEFTNALVERQQTGGWRTATFRQALETLLRLMAPAAPHVAEELWQLTGHSGSVHRQSWPEWDPEAAQDEIAKIAVQVDGKLRAVIDAPVEAPQAEVEAQAIQALKQDKNRHHLSGREVVRIVYIPGRVLNLVTRATINLEQAGDR
ncbi:MAG: leucine--tRNA ligase [Chloroflexota bacterium]|nr:MAG: leucine--tRNA ligase [Chloroflexota bacterium]